MEDLNIRNRSSNHLVECSHLKIFFKILPYIKNEIIKCLCCHTMFKEEDRRRNDRSSFSPLLFISPCKQLVGTQLISLLNALIGPSAASSARTRGLLA